MEKGKFMYDTSDAAIRKAFKKLLAEMPLDQITVIVLSQNAGITRQTFYYHYSSIADLLEDILECEIALRRRGGTLSFAEFMRDLLDFINANDVWLQNICHTSYQPLLTNIVGGIARRAASAIVDQNMKSYDMTVSERDRKFLVDSYGAMMVSVLLKFMEERPEKRQDTVKAASLMRTVFDRSVAAVLSGFDQSNIWLKTEA